MLNAIHAATHSSGYEKPATRRSDNPWHFGSEETFLSLGATTAQPERRTVRTRLDLAGKAVEQRRPIRRRVLRWAHSHS
ncbi:hypothetical protein MXD62_11065 [Frankia sp. Mgl5]|uniref:hypothetical protein n=1 Tax=Frankia sp. Mgl5 TaxID=2933793 RepID=UPI00201096D4|nr:hypothetical protein [Frankia sp. Mgl5]MCK9927703.1 hypothetical protein [Frankia sp. Mgl5]